MYEFMLAMALGAGLFVVISGCIFLGSLMLLLTREIWRDFTGGRLK